MTRRAVVFVMIGCFAAFVATVGAQQSDSKKEHEFKGKVEKVDAKAKTVTVAGEAVPGWMGAMTMTFAVDKDAVLATLKSGDQINAKVHDGDFQKLYNVKVVPPKAEAAAKKK